MKIKPIIARNAFELAEILELSTADEIKMETRRQINDKIVEAIIASGHREKTFKIFRGRPGRIATRPYSSPCTE